ncbi:DNA cytosine methyltransferase [Streptomyces sp. RTd22]|uniref:DNA cytosine methyltransferase n=1 Tax=Streptomyces sp. RTd22 TaxID=1841249 RepID=UPI0007DC40AB|nr:DNA cytosine methyltransferase [Streptomyces sp. RTd22]
MPILGLCAGFGGLEIAVNELTGEEVAYVAEIDPHAAKILAHYHPDVPNLGDITSIDWTELIGLVDIICAGFPCQDISNAGHRKGIDGEKSGVWRDVAEAIRILRPRLVFLENVSAIARRGLDRVLGDLASIGYDARWMCFRASEVGAAHHRDRWFCVAFPAADTTGERLEGGNGESWSGGETAPQRGGATPAGASPGVTAPSDPEGKRRPEGGAQPAGQQRQLHALASGRGASPADSNGLRWDRRSGELRKGWRDEPSDGGHSPSKWWGEYRSAIYRWECVLGVPAPYPTQIGPRGGRRLSAAFSEWLMGIPDRVTSVPDLSRSQQLHKVGNGVVPHQAYAAYRLILLELLLAERLELAA